jgi:MFS family permease
MMQTQFGATTDQVQWDATAYTLALGIVVPISGWLGDRYGLDRIYRYALIGFAAGSALCGLAWSLNILIAFRIIQAIGGGLLPAVAQALLYRMVPRDKIGRRPDHRRLPRRIRELAADLLHQHPHRRARSGGGVRRAAALPQKER